MKHRKCKGDIVLNLTDSYIIQSPSMNISTKGITPGMIEIGFSPEKKQPKLTCDKCMQEFSGKDEFEDEIICVCGICTLEFRPSQIRVTDFLPFICEDCASSKVPRTLRNNTTIDNSIQTRMMSLYGEVLQKQENPTLLALLMKKQ